MTQWRKHEGERKKNTKIGNSPHECVCLRRSRPSGIDEYEFCCVLGKVEICMRELTKILCQINIHFPSLIYVCTVKLMQKLPEKIKLHVNIVFLFVFIEIEIYASEKINFINLFCK